MRVRRHSSLLHTSCVNHVSGRRGRQTGEGCLNLNRFESHQGHLDVAAGLSRNTTVSLFGRGQEGYQITADCGSVRWQTDRRLANWLPWLVAAVILTGSNWQLPANVEGTSGRSESGGFGTNERAGPQLCGPMRGQGWIVSVLAQPRIH